MCWPYSCTSYKIDNKLLRTALHSSHGGEGGSDVASVRRAKARAPCKITPCQIYRTYLPHLNPCKIHTCTHCQGYMTHLKVPP